MLKFHFLRPYWLWLLVPMLFFLVYLWRNKQENQAWEKVCDKHLLTAQLVTYSTSYKNLHGWFLLLVLGWFLAIFSLSGPSWTQVNQSLYLSAHSQVIVLDLSSAMNAQDILPNRLSRAKYKILDMLKQQKEGQLALLIFSAEPYVASPLTHDSATIATMIPELETHFMPAQGSNIALALKKAGELIDQTGLKEGDILLVTASAVKPADIEIAKKLQQEGKRISVLAIATKQGAPIPVHQGFLKDNVGQTLMSRLDEKGLVELSKNGGGRYVVFTSNNQDIEQLLSFTQNNSALNLSKQEQSLQTMAWQDQGLYFVIALLPLALLAFRRGWFERL